MLDTPIRIFIRTDSCLKKKKKKMITRNFKRLLFQRVRKFALILKCLQIPPKSILSANPLFFYNVRKFPL